MANVGVIFARLRVVLRHALKDDDDVDENTQGSIDDPW